MFPSPFDYQRVASVDEAIKLLSQSDGEAKLLAGGHSLLPTMKIRLAAPSLLIDLAGIPDLAGVRQDGDTISIGALTTHRAIEINDILLSSCPILPQTASIIGDQQVRNRGTIGGALAHADPAADYPAVILALEATIIAHGPGGSREIPADEFFIDLLTTALEPNEVLTEIRIPVPATGSGMNYQKLPNQASGYATVGVAAIIHRNADGVCNRARIGVTGAAAHAQRARATEAALIGKQLNEQTIREAAALAGDGIDFLDDLHAPESYRHQITIGLTQRAINASL